MAYIDLAPTKKQHISYTLLDDDSTRFLLMGGGAGGGKSWLGCEWILRNCYLYPKSRWFIGRKELKRLMNTTYITWQKVCDFHNIPRTSWKLNGQYNYIEFVSGKAKGSRVDLVDMKKMPTDEKFERFGSLECTGGFIEEAGEVPFKAFDIIKTRVGRHMNREYGLLPPKILLTCNPTQNWLYRVFYKPWRNRALEDGYAFIQSLYMDNPFTAEEYGEQLAQIKDLIDKARLKDGLWEYEQDEFALMSLDSIIEMFETPLDDGLKYLTVDVARYGGDRTIIGLWHGYKLVRVWVFTKQKTTKTSEFVYDLMVDEHIPFSRVVVDEGGVGGGVVDQLDGVHGYMGGRAAIMKDKTEVEEMDDKYANITATYLARENFKNLRSQCGFKFAEWVNEHSVSIEAELTEEQREDIVEELQQLRRLDTIADAPLQLVPKEDMKEALGRSPDFADMLTMRVYFDLIKEVKRPRYNPPSQKKLFEQGITSPWGGAGDYGVGGFTLPKS